MKKKAQCVHQEMLLLAVPLWLIGCVRLYVDNGSTIGVFRAWHPVTWLLMVLLIVPCALAGEKLSHAVPTKLSPFWTANKDQLQWVHPWSRLDSFVKFKHSLNKYNPLESELT